MTLIAASFVGGFLSLLHLLNRVRKLEARQRTLGSIVNALAADPTLCCPHGVLRALHCPACVREGELAGRA